MSSSDSGFFESSFSRTRSLLRTPTAIRPGSVIHRRSLQFFSHKTRETPCRPASRPPRTSGQPTMLNASSSSSTKSAAKKSKSLAIKSKASKRSGTVLRAVPATTACATAPLSLSPLEQDMAILPNQEILTNIGRLSPASDGHSAVRFPPQNNASRPRAHSSSAVLSPSHATPDTRLFSGSADPKSIIGTYKHGVFHWEHKENGAQNSQSLRSTTAFVRTTSAPQSPSSSKRRRPRIQVIIPDDRLNQPLPSTPFFTHARTVSAGPVSGHQVSPPSASKSSRARYSIVSPLSSQQQQRPHNNFMVSINPTLPRTQQGSPSKNNVTSHSTSSDESHADDASSVYSQPSSMTSSEATSPPADESKSNLRKCTATSNYHVGSPVDAGIFNDAARVFSKSGAAYVQSGPSPPSQISPRPRRCAHHPPTEEYVPFQPTCAIRPLRKASNDPIQRKPTIRRSSHQSTRRRSLASNGTMGVLNQARSRSQTKELSNGLPSPTLSEAEDALEHHLTSFSEAETDLEQHMTSMTDDNPFKWDELLEETESIHRTPPGPPPTVPRKSSKRQPLTGPANFRLSKVPGDHIASQLKRNRSLGNNKGLTIEIPVKSKRAHDSFMLSPIPLIPEVPAIPPKDVKRSITPAIAENIILGILQSLDTLDDLFATAVVNAGFYRVFKRHELELMKATLKKMSPPAWEYREICYPGHDQLSPEDLPRQDYSPKTYYEHYRCDSLIIDALKSLIKDTCQADLRPEISVGLVSEDYSEYSRVDDALWRIWTFCKLFGSGRGREEDVVAQLDWLKGGELVHQKTCTYSILTTDSIDMSDTLASAPECFAQGNEGGLTAQQLWDMIELWNCLGALLQPLRGEGRTAQAREYGVYDQTEIGGGDIDGEELMLDEWCCYILSLGLAPILDLAVPCRKSSDPSAFMLASQKGWMDWKPPLSNKSRREFLGKVAGDLYEDRIAATFAQSSTKEVQRQVSKQRIQRHITDIRRRKIEISMSQERPMSEWEGVIDNLTRPRALPPSSNIVSYIPSLQSAAPNSAPSQQLSVNMAELPASRTPPPVRSQSPPRRIVAEPLLPTPPPSTVPSVADNWEARSIAPSMPSIEEHPVYRADSIPEMPTLEEHPSFKHHLRQMNYHHGPVASYTTTTPSTSSFEQHPVFQQHPLQREIFYTDPSQNTAEKAVYRIVEMGFTAEQARYALRVTDIGDGLRVDRAVELLLRENI